MDPRVHLKVKRNKTSPKSVNGENKDKSQKAPPKIKLKPASLKS